MKSGYVSIIGKPNTGKSTLLNQLLKFKLSAVSHKAQTTRASIQGIYMDDDSQIIFYDTPGFLKTKNMLEEWMLRDIKESVKSADIVLFLFEERNYKERFEINLSPNQHSIAVLNKIDRISAQEGEIIEKELKESFEDVILISALNNMNLDILVNTIKKYLPHDNLFYPEDIITEKPERFFVSEFVRQSIFEIYGDEVPYSTGIIVDEFTEKPDRKDYIRVKLLVERDSQKGILIGEKGRALKEVGVRSRRMIEEFLGRDVFLEIFVKVEKGWKDNKGLLKRMWEQT
ncbi:TPA: GTPase Era [candidate division WOR-3 bacterium]|uniref:GTPase Era n=1 Tax=candidate division WOR-3 bacterium TaxID=2052148 RepID=A0A350H8L6_UNCW3|nr:GTPase Era [candidate division WOR-3 bacterium]